MDLVPSIYHETQEAGSMLCAQHCLNNLLQSNIYSSQDLAEIAQRLDVLESAQLDQPIQAGESQNYDDSGFFSIMVIEEALAVFGLKLLRWQSRDMRAYHDAPETMEGFILNHQLHWYTIRRFGKPDRCYNLDSCTPKPQWISPMYLGLTLREAENQGYSIFVVVPSDDSVISGLPPCDAAERALNLPPPSSHSDSYSSSSSVAAVVPRFFSGAGNVLGAASGGGSASSLVPQNHPKRRPEELSDEEGNVDGGGSSVEDESEKRRRRPRLESEQGSTTTGTSSSTGSLGVGGLDLSEEDQMAFAISESLRMSKLADTAEGAGEDDDIQIIERGTSEEMKGKGKRRETGKQSSGGGEKRNHEEEEFQAALKASLEQTKVEEVVHEEEEDDTPTLEELRQRRLARFGG